MIEIGPKARGALGPELSAYLPIITQVFDEFGFSCRITHIRDGQHSEGSLHYVGNAIDVIWLEYQDISKDVSEGIKEELYLKLNGFPKSAGLMPDYDVVYEGSHFHIEFQPKLDDVAYREQVVKYLYGG